ncbi:putative membrane protein [Bacilli bacterium PM5-9]|nr:putative membrane protein [Bacilli bacterium PM5-9]
MKKNITFGLALIILAIFIILNSLNYIGGFSTLTVILSFLLVWLLLASLFKIDFFGIFISLGLGFVLYKEYLGFDYINSFTIIFVSILLGIGFSMIFGRKNVYYTHNRFEHSRYHHHDDRHDYKEGQFRERGTNRTNIFDESDQQIEDDVITYSATLCDSTRFVRSKNLKKGIFRVELGSLSIYLDQATLSSNGAEIELFSRLGTIKLFVPRDTFIVNELSANLGEIKLPYNDIEDLEYNKIILKGEVTLGEIKVIRL